LQVTNSYRNHHDQVLQKIPTGINMFKCFKNSYRNHHEPWLSVSKTPKGINRIKFVKKTPTGINMIKCFKNSYRNHHDQVLQILLHEFNGIGSFKIPWFAGEFWSLSPGNHHQYTIWLKCFKKNQIFHLLSIRSSVMLLLPLIIDMSRRGRFEETTLQVTWLYVINF
jgi:hypothetical protein